MADEHGKFWTATRSWRQLKMPGTPPEICAVGVLATVMSNLGFERYLDGLGLELVRTAVGDRNVVDYMRNRSNVR